MTKTWAKIVKALLGKKWNHRPVFSSCWIHITPFFPLPPHTARTSHCSGWYTWTTSMKREDRIPSIPVYIFLTSGRLHRVSNQGTFDLWEPGQSKERWSSAMEKPLSTQRDAICRVESRSAGPRWVQRVFPNRENNCNMTVGLESRF